MSARKWSTNSSTLSLHASRRSTKPGLRGPTWRLCCEVSSRFLMRSVNVQSAGCVPHDLRIPRSRLPERLKRCPAVHCQVQQSTMQFRYTLLPREVSRCSHTAKSGIQASSELPLCWLAKRHYWKAHASCIYHLTPTLAGVRDPEDCQWPSELKRDDLPIKQGTHMHRSYARTVQYASGSSCMPV